MNYGWAVVEMNPVNIILLITPPGSKLLFSAMLKQIDRLFCRSPSTVTKAQCTSLKFATAHEELYCHKPMDLLALTMASAGSLFPSHFFFQLLQDQLGPSKILKIYWRSVCHQGADINRREPLLCPICSAKCFYFSWQDMLHMQSCITWKLIYLQYNAFPYYLPRIINLKPNLYK